ncbi:MAG TPA: hypothetical protein VJ948_00410 [Acidimicrobiia bacterium]|nr:hypothetical protein [Acidimicrobiia bacterium]
MTSQEWPGWFRWAIRLIAVIVIVAGAWILWSERQVNTAGNAVAWFIGDLEPTAGASAEGAYDRLCEAEQERIAKHEFLRTGGSDYDFLGEFGVSALDSQYPDHETLRSDITAVWWDLEIERERDREIVRINMVRERDWWEFQGDWKICGVEFRGE